jgi:pimeloyl-ACP methyl ester carboxylesterase
VWEAVTIGGRPADVFTPAGRPRFVLVFLPDLDDVTLRANPAWTAILEGNHLACVSPTGGDSWWASRICPAFDPAKSGEAYLLDDVLPWALGRLGVGENAVALAGVGAGGQGALRLGFKYPDRVRTVASLAGSIDHYELYGRGTCLDEMYPTREHCRQDGVMLHVHPHDWPPNVWFACDPDSPWLRGNDRLHEKLLALGVPHTFDFTTRACGHAWTYYDALAPALSRFVVAGLEKEARRLL